MLITGAVLIVIAVLVFAIGVYMVLTQAKITVTTATLPPGGNITLGTANPDRILTVSYMDSINKPLEIYVTAPGQWSQKYVNGYYVVAYAVLSGKGNLYLINNYSIPVTVTYYIISGLRTGGAFELMGIVIGIIGVILAILGAVLRPRR